MKLRILLIGFIIICTHSTAQYALTDSIKLDPIVQNAHIQLITHTEIVENQYTTLKEVLSDQAGFYVSTDWLSPNVSFRGENTGFQANSSSVKFLIDGHDTQFQTTGANLMGVESFPLSGIGRIEIMKGPMAARYGAGAGQVVINIIPFQKDELEFISILYKNRSIESSLVEGAFGSTGKKSSFQISFLSGEMDRSRLGLEEAPNDQMNQNLINQYSGFNPFDTTSRNDY